jgi:eukaryotic-like serine/threonine-protein kinase
VGAINASGGAGGSAQGSARLIGQQIAHFLLQEHIGSGGVASVFRAFDQLQGRTVALKLLYASNDDAKLQRFRREALIAGALRHPHIVRTLQVGSERRGGIAYIAMELVEGESLDDLLRRRGRLTAQETCTLLAPIARALAEASRSGIVHRDVKPSNVLLRTANPGIPHSVWLESLDYPVVPLLSDFGIARFMDVPELTIIGRTVGTPAYMAPEQCTGRRDVDGRADIYSLGAVLYRAVTGRLPYIGTTPQILHAHVFDPLVVDTDELELLPANVIGILQRSMAKTPDHRYDSADWMADELAAVAELESAATCVVARPADGFRWSCEDISTTESPVAASRNETVLVSAPGEGGHLIPVEAEVHASPHSLSFPWLRRWMGMLGL